MKTCCTAATAALLAVGMMLAGCAPERLGRSPVGAALGVPPSHVGEPADIGYRRGYPGGVVSVSHPLAAAAGARMLERGGNAIDAAAAIQFALNVVEPQFSGIGGGGFMMIHLAGSTRSFVVDSRETAPAAATADMLQGLGFAEASTSAISVGVPGTVMGVAQALERWGTLSLAEVLEPAIELAGQGFPVNRYLSTDSADPRTALQPETAAVFRLPDGSPLPVGYRLRQPDLARSFRLIADQGIRAFYRGEIAEAIVGAQNRSRSGPRGAGRMTRADLAGYTVSVHDALVGSYRGFQVQTMPPPSSGGLSVLMMLKLLEPFPIGSGGAGWEFGGRRTMNVMIEAMRLTFADRAVWMGDPDYVPVPVEALLSECFLATRRALIDTDARMATPPAGDPRGCAGGPEKSPAGPVPRPGEPHEAGHTTHFTVVDRWGNIVSYTSTIEHTWGTGIMVPGYGFLLNNELTDFNFTPRFDPGRGDPGANDVAPFKRPRSSMAPTLLFEDGHPVAAYGSPGGATIINTVLNITLNLIDHRMDLQRAIDAPRLSVTSAAGTPSCEAGFADDALRFLSGLGHPFPQPDGKPDCRASIGSVQGIVIDSANGRRHGAADQRREGTVIGLPRAADAEPAGGDRPAPDTPSSYRPRAP